MTPDLILMVLWAGAALSLTVVNGTIGAKVYLPAPESWAGHILAALYLSLLLLSLMQTARAAARLRLSALFLLLAGGAFAIPLGVVLLLNQQHLVPPLWLYLTANNLFLPIAAALVGAGVGRIIKHPNTLLAGAAFAAFFDLVVVTMGSVNQFLKNNPSVVTAVSIGTPQVLAGQHTRQIQILSGVTIGPADVLFLALFLSAVHFMKLSARATFAWMFLLLTTALVIVDSTSLPIPALAPMGIAVLIANARHGAFTREEKSALIYGGGFAVFCAILIVVGSRFLIPHK